MEQLSPLLEKPPPARGGAPCRWGSETVTAFFAALQFLTITPPVVRRPITAAEMGRSVGFFPLVGLALGGVLWGIDWAAVYFWPANLAAALTLASWAIFTGGLHLDGLLDSLDGLFGGRTPDDRLRIMKDARVGAFAVIGGSLFVLLKYLALAAAEDRLVLLLAPMIGRAALVLGIMCFPYARAAGLGRALKDHAGWREAALAALTAIPAAWLIGAERGLIALAAVLCAAWLIGRFALRRLPGLTGDIYGAICAIGELIVLLIFAARIAA